MSDNKQINMGLGELGNPNIVFSRKFRWILESTNLPSHYVSDVSFDFVTKTVNLSYYDIIINGKEGMHALQWADGLANKKYFDETITFTALDGCGNHLYKLTFKDLTLVSHTANFNYESSDCSKTLLTVKYDIVHKQLIACPDQFDRYSWSFEIGGKEYPISWSGNKRPTLHIEETELNFLNGKTWTPGKAHWENLKFFTSKDVNEILAPSIVDGRKFNCSFKLYNGKNLAETWMTKEAWATKTIFSESQLYVELVIDKMEYDNFHPILH